MKRFIITCFLSVSLVFRAAADEGMWLPLLLGQQVYNDMVKKGLKLSKEQLYNVNKASIKDAIIIFGNGCTGEIVSSKGLIFTNHHCGYGAIASASSVEHNYLRDGFYAKNNSEEIPTNLTVQFLVRIDDVTKEVNDSLAGLSGAARASKQAAVISHINSRMSDLSKNLETRVSPLFKGNQFLAFVYQRYNDVRLVGTPPESVGKFGGDTDNWEWPRHTGDFSVFRVYATADGKPAPYTTTNVPLKAKYHLPISLKGVKENDFAMIFGYPGSTNRYESSYGVQLATEVNNPTLVKLRDMRLKYMFEQMKDDPATKLQLASDYASIANYWKFFKGETEQLLKYDVLGQKKKEEEAFVKWAQSKPEYKTIFTDLEQTYAAWRPYALHRVYITEGILGSPLLSFAASLQQLEAALAKPNAASADIQKAIESVSNARQNFQKAHNRPSDKNIVTSVLQMYYNEVPKDQQPTALYEAIRSEYGALDKASTYERYTDQVFSNTIILNDAKWNAFVRNPDVTTLQQDLAYNLASAFIRNYQSKYLPQYQQFVSQNNEWGRLYLKGVREMNPGKALYPDATFTMRVSYGKVDDYQPRDGVTYDYVTTMKGVLEKYKPGDYEFDLPEGLVSLAKEKNYGPYKDARTGDLVVNFITSNDITGGNSGSPVINGNGELIGLAFDGNYEALSHKIAFDKDLNRTINVDIRYVLWLIDRMGGADHIIKELTIRK
ncbi:S46 family peptidase [Telluribacter sp. SYSU D00476]|uniref:S46 family peptidase n=1 Tax=Telluribacter sp. SYSU D00476 TaxID=2811430 RepID=UPI001FF31E5D|nr:S46 family peptidase [Telluribacter sp. SYSU D00476]